MYGLIQMSVSLSYLFIYLFIYLFVYLLTYLFKTIKTNNYCIGNGQTGEPYSLPCIVFNSYTRTRTWAINQL